MVYVVKMDVNIPETWSEEKLQDYGSRPAHIHFFVTKPGYRKLTTQINIEGDPLTFDDFAFATKQELGPHISRHTADEAEAKGFEKEPFAFAEFNFNILKEETAKDDGENHRTRALAAN